MDDKYTTRGADMDRDQIIEEKEKCVDKWKDTFALDNLENQYKLEVATLIENQHLMNQIASNQESEFIEVSLPLVHHIYSNLVAQKLVSIQAMLGPIAPSFYLRFRYTNTEGAVDLSGDVIKLMVESEEVKAKTRKLKSVRNIASYGDISIEKLGTTISNEMTREVVTDLRVNAGTVAKFNLSDAAKSDDIKDRYEALYTRLIQVSGVMHRKTLRGGANWLYTSPEVAALFMSANSRHCSAEEMCEGGDRILYCGTICNRWRLYSDTDFPQNQILIGYKGDDNLDSGYQYCPYIPLTPSPTGEFSRVPGILARYGKRLLREGSKFYARVTIEGFDGKGEFNEKVERICKEIEKEKETS